MKQYHSWGRYPEAQPDEITWLNWRSDSPDFAAFDRPVLAYGQGRSYGDACLNDGGVVIDTSKLRRFISFDRKTGVLRSEAGVTLDEILKTIVPGGWFLPVTPGTKYVSVGGAIANDVHGKNHHRAGTFGLHVKSFELLRSTGERLLCSPDRNTELFRATIGGLGLTGLIVWAEFQLKPIRGPFISMERRRFESLDEFFTLSAESDRDYEYTVAWVDCLARGASVGRGIFIRGNHDEAAPEQFKKAQIKKTQRNIRVPFDFPSVCLNSLTMKMFNETYYRMERGTNKVVHYDPFFYPLDSITDWNRMYGRRGFLQYQCVVPPSVEREAVSEILTRTARAGEGSFLAVLKRFGDIASPGLISFPKPGSTLCLDFAYREERTLNLLDSLDRIVRESGGAVYPAKDARMSAESFQSYFPNWKEFARYVDPRFSSGFWRRVTAQSGGMRG